MHFTEKTDLYCIIFETNILTEMAICVAGDCKSNSRQGKAYVFINFQGMEI